MTNISKEHIGQLGRTAKDVITGFNGVISLVSFDLYGCVQFVITPPVDKDGNAVDGRWFDVTRLELKNKKSPIPVPHFTNEDAIGNLGFKAKDVVTGFSGVVSSVGFNLFGYTQFTLTPEANNNGKANEGGWFDISRLKLKSTKPVMAIPDFDKGYIAEGKKGPAEKTIP